MDMRVVQDRDRGTIGMLCQVPCSLLKPNIIPPTRTFMLELRTPLNNDNVPSGHYVYRGAQILTRVRHVSINTSRI